MCLCVCVCVCLCVYVAFACVCVCIFSMGHHLVMMERLVQSSKHQMYGNWSLVFLVDRVGYLGELVCGEDLDISYGPTVVTRPMSYPDQRANPALLGRQIALIRDTAIRSFGYRWH